MTTPPDKGSAVWLNEPSIPRKIEENTLQTHFRLDPHADRIPVMLESPFAANLQTSQEIHERYLERCLADSIQRNEAPFASHRLYSGVLDDGRADERAIGIACGEVYRIHVDKVVVYTDYGISSEMLQGISRTIEVAKLIPTSIEFRQIGTNDAPNGRKKG